MPTVPSVSNSSAATGTNAFNSLTSEEFMRIIMTELSQQDPLKPNDTNQMVQELSSLRSIQSDIQLVSKLDAVVSQNQLASAGALIGKFVVGLTDSGVRVGGQVVSVSRTAEGPILNLNEGSRVRFENIDLMQLVVEEAPDDTTNPPNDTPPADDET